VAAEHQHHIPGSRRPDLLRRAQGDIRLEEAGSHLRSCSLTYLIFSTCVAPGTHTAYGLRSLSPGMTTTRVAPPADRLLGCLPHIFVCVAQSFRWKSYLQYLTCGDLRRPHRFFILRMGSFSPQEAPSD
jgi:hypothetical protein